MPIAPQTAVVLVTSDRAQILPADQITKKIIGEKAFGLSCIPTEWSLPFIVVSSDLFSAYQKSIDSTSKTKLINEWVTPINSALANIGLDSNTPIWIRSSGIAESISDRGNLHSEQSLVGRVSEGILACLGQIEALIKSTDELICLVIQKAVVPVSAKGHLSDERQYAQEARDWIGEIENSTQLLAPHFEIHLRKWRKKKDEDSYNTPLQCLLGVTINRALEPVAWWAYNNSTRMHFEWVWNGKFIYIVQADAAVEALGFDPTAATKSHQKRGAKETPLKCLVDISEIHAQRFNKIKNVKLYKRLGLPSCPIFVLDDEEIFAELLDGQVRDDLKKDMELLCEHSLVIRTDIETQEQAKRQLLPRTCEVRDVNDAISFLRNTLNNFASNEIKEAVAFIFHNFVPAISSAFAYAVPGTRKVHIECLWGLPEGLYYNSHDQITVDTRKISITNIENNDIEKFTIYYKERYKGYCVAPNNTGNWIRQAIAKPYDWRRAISNDAWIREIALQSRQIAEAEGTPLSIMWFVGVPLKFSPKPTFPWYHEHCVVQDVHRQSARKRKNVWDKTLTIETAADVARLQEESKLHHSLVRQIRLQPKDNDLLRNRSLLEAVGALAKKIDAVIFLEGGMLSHAYYQLIKTNAKIDIANPFHFPDEKRDFQKLVRDRVPQKIAYGGEAAKILKLSGDDFLRALREKLVEEAIEALDAKSHDQLLEELADVSEVIDGMLTQLKSTKKELLQIKNQKRAASGGFEEGIVLIETANPGIAPYSATAELFEDETATSISQAQGSISIGTAAIRRWEDKRERPTGNEHLLNLTVPLTQDAWSTESREITVEESSDTAIRARVIGARKGSTMTIEISLFLLPRQLSLFPSDS